MKAKFAITFFAVVVLLTGCSKKEEANNTANYLREVKNDQIDLRFTYEEGTVEYEGSVNLPTPCHELRTAASESSTNSKEFVLDITIIEPDADVMCAQVITPESISDSISGFEESVVVKVNLNGESQ